VLAAGTGPFLHHMRIRRVKVRVRVRVTVVRKWTTPLATFEKK